MNSVKEQVVHVFHLWLGSILSAVEYVFHVAREVYYWRSSTATCEVFSQLHTSVGIPNGTQEDSHFVGFFKILQFLSVNQFFNHLPG